MSSDPRTPTRYTRFNPDGSGRHPVGEYKKPEPPKPTKSQSALEYVLFAVFGGLIILAGVAIWSTYDPKHKVVPNRIEAGLKQDRVNIVVIGVGGESHPGGGKDLADSILFVSLKPSTKHVAVVSVPRDFWVKVGRYGVHRLNQAHAIGNESGYPGEGPGLLCDTISEMFNQPVHGFVRIDFSAFEKIINDLGGIDVYVQRSFYDYLFKDGFRQGWHHLDGKHALNYARYRYILGPEGDNFARELRQQQVLNALRDKVQKRNPQDALNMLQAVNTLSNATETNLTTPQMVSLFRTFKDVRREDVRNVSLKPFTQIFMVTRLSDPGQAVRTKTGDYRQLHAVAKDIFSSTAPIATEDQIHMAATPPAPQTQTQSVLSALP